MVLISQYTNATIEWGCMMDGLNTELQEKLDRLKSHLKELNSLAVGFSGGVDSSFLLAVAHEVLGDRALAVTSADVSVPEREVREAKAFCEERGIRQVICRIDPMKEEAYRNNAPEIGRASCRERV